jgi:hypothetical protein
MYKVYTLNESEQWDQYYNRIDHNDIYYKMEFFRAFEKFEGSQAFLFVYEEGNDLAYYPFFKRIIEDSPYFDITSQYTYGGPLFNFSEDNKDFVFNFRNAFGIFCKENDIISEFIRFHPFLNNRKVIEEFVAVKCVNEGIYIDLTKQTENIDADYRQDIRYQINKAKRIGHKVVFSKNVEDLDIFYPIYEHTLKRNNADSNHYFLNKELLKLLINELKDNFEFIFILINDIYVSAELDLFTEKYVHAVIGGTLKDYLRGHPNDLLRHALTVRHNGNKQTKLILGSGGIKGDGIYEYKRKFNPTGTYELYMGQKIHDVAKYDELVEQLKRKQPDKELNLNFFPLYRS